MSRKPILSTLSGEAQILLNDLIHKGHEIGDLSRQAYPGGRLVRGKVERSQ